MKIATQVAIRRATPNDVVQLTELVEQYRDFYRQERDDKTNQYLIDRISKNESVIFVAEIDGLLVGFTQCYPTFSTLSLSGARILCSSLRRLH